MWAVRICKSIKAALVAAYAVSDLVSFVCFDLVDKLRISVLGPSHYNHVYFVFFEHFLSDTRLIKAPYSDRQHTCLFSDPCSIVYIEALWNVYRWYFIHISRGYYVTSRNVEYIYSLSTCQLAELDDFFNCQSAFKEIIMRIYSHEQWHVFRHIGSDRSYCFKRELCAVLKASAILIGAVIDAA